MPKDYKHLSRRQKNRRLLAYERNNKLQPSQLTSSIEDSELNLSIEQENCSVQVEQSTLESVPCRNILEVVYDNSPSTENSVVGTSDHKLSTQHSSEKIVEKSEPLALWLATWALNHKIPHTALSPLLRQLKTFGHGGLPCDARTLLNTPRTCVIDSWSVGSYFHYGIERAITEQLRHKRLTFVSNKILIDLNFDGLPLSKSSKSQLWPILGKIYHDDLNQPFLIGAYHGPTKPPSVSEYLRQFINEYNSLVEHGLHILDEDYTIAIRSIICDSPARSYITCTKSHNGYFGCGKCTQEGHYDNHRMLFLECDSPLRTDDNFHERHQEEHHTGFSPLETISIGMISQFPIDYMHLICLGVTKKLLGIWLHGLHTLRLSGSKIQQLSSNLISISQWIPKEFARKPRGLDELQRWKATEFRIFLLYVGSVVLQDILTRDQLLHLNTLNCATRILCHPTNCYTNNRYAQELLLHFVDTFKILYGEDSIIYNVHNLIHIHADVLKFGALDNFAAFPFENFMQTLKNLLRKSDRPLPQLYNRLTEMSQIPPNKTCKKSMTPVLHKKSCKVMPLNCTDAHQSILYNNFELKTHEPNNCCLLNDSSIVLIEHIGFKNGLPVIIGKKLLNPKALPTYPIDSTDMNMYVVGDLSTDLEVWSVQDIQNKVLKLPYRDKWYIIPFLHSAMK